MNKSYAVGADVGGSHVTAAVIDLDHGTILPDTLRERDVDTGEDELFFEKRIESIVNVLKNGMLK